MDDIKLDAFQALYAEISVQTDLLIQIASWLKIANYNYYNPAHPLSDADRLAVVKEIETSVINSKHAFLEDTNLVDKP